jgi:hypothetical protein
VVAGGSAGAGSLSVVGADGAVVDDGVAVDGGVVGAPRPSCVVCGVDVSVSSPGHVGNDVVDVGDVVDVVDVGDGDDVLPFAGTVVPGLTGIVEVGSSAVEGDGAAEDDEGAVVDAGSASVAVVVARGASERGGDGRRPVDGDG